MNEDMRDANSNQLHGHDDGVQGGEGAGEPKAGEGEELAVDDRAAEREAEPLVVVLRAHSELVNVAWRPQRGGKD